MQAAAVARHVVDGNLANSLLRVGASQSLATAGAGLFELQQAGG